MRTTEDTRRAFLAHARAMVDWWEKESRAPAVREKLDGVVFSLLVAIDGEAGDLPPFELRPLDEQGAAGEDIAGGLHEAWCRKETG